MIPEAREVHLSRKDRKVLEACCRSPVTLQRDLKRARIVLLAAAGRSTRSIAKEVGVQPRIVSRWRHRYADHGLEGLQDKPRPGKQPIYTKATDRRILKLLDKPPPQGFARWTGPLLAEALGDVDVQYIWRFLRSHKIDLAARKSWCESNDPNFTAKHPQEKRALAQGSSQCAISFHADKRILAQSGRGMVLDLAGAVAQRRLLHKPQTAPGAHRCLHQRI